MNLSVLSKHRNVIYGICALWIVGLHAVNNFGFWPNVSGLVLDVLKWFFTKSYGVDVFVFLSGISLYYSFDNDSSYTTFIQKRLRRILPALLLTYGVKWILQVLDGNHELPWLFWHLSLVPFYVDGNKDGAWFFAFIIVLYLAYPYIHAFIYGSNREERGSERAIVVRAAAVCVGACLLYWLSHKYALSWFWKVEIALARVPVFIVGCYLGHRIKSGRAVLPASWTAALVVSSLVWFYLLVGPVRDLGAWWYRLFGSLSGIVFAIAFALISEAAVRIGWEVLLNPLRSVGSYSLELYGAHLVLYYGVFFIQSVEGSLALLAAYIPLSMLWSWLCVRLFEPALIESTSRIWRKITAKG